MAIIVSSGEVSSGIIVSYDSMYVYEGGTANDTTVLHGSMHVSYGGTANSTAVNRGGSMYIANGGTATVIENGGYVEIADGATVDFIPNSFYGIVVSGTAEPLVLHSGTTANLTLIDYSGRMVVYSGGVANSTLVEKDGGRITVSGGVVNSTVIACEGTNMTVAAGGTANDTILSCGYLLVNFSGTANGIRTVGSALITARYRATVRDAEVNSFGMLAVSSLGTAESAVVNRGGSMCVYSGGIATDIIENGGYVEIASGASVTFKPNTFSGLILYGGYNWGDSAVATLHSGTTANSTTVNISGDLHVFDGGVANSTIVNSWGGLYVYDGGVANSTTVNGYGHLYVSSGGVVNDTVVNGYYGSAAIRVDGGVVNGLSAFSDPSNDSWTCADIESRGKLTGAVTLVNRAVVSAFTGSIVDFDISTVAPGGAARINDLSLIQGTPNYTITVAGSQAQRSGTYILAAGASGFDKTVTVYDDMAQILGGLRVGETITVHDVSYSLALADETLSLTVSNPGGGAPRVLSVAADVTTETSGFVKVTATFSADTVTAQYSSDGETWKDYSSGVTMAANGTVYFRAVGEAGALSPTASYHVTNIVDAGTVSELVTFEGADAVIDGRTFGRSVAAGTLVNSDDKNWYDHDGSLVMTVENGNFNNVLVGADLVQSGYSERIGNVNLTIDGGVFAYQVSGGMYYVPRSNRGEAVLTGDIDFTITGGTFNGRVYGGCLARNGYGNRTTVSGNVNLTVNAVNHIGIMNHIVAGSFDDGRIEGDVSVTFSGLGSNLDFTGTVSGGSGSAYYYRDDLGNRLCKSYVDGERKIVFSGFNGDFDAKFAAFSSIRFTGNSEVVFTDAAQDASDLETWEFDYGSTVSGIGRNDFSGDTLNIGTSGWEGAGDWEMLFGGDRTFTGWEEFAAVAIGGETATFDGSLWRSASYSLSLEEAGENRYLKVAKLV